MDKKTNTELALEEAIAQLRRCAKVLEEVSETMYMAADAITMIGEVDDA